MKKVIVCGSGIGGMVTAIYLAVKGYEVEIFEKNSKPGGKNNQFEKDGFRFDTGAGQLLMLFVIEEFFREINKDISDYITFEKKNSARKYFWNDGTVFEQFFENDKLKKELEDTFGESDAAGYFDYLNYGKLFYDLFKENFLNDEFRIRNFITRKGIRNFSKFLSGRSLNDVSNKFFKSKKLRQLMDRYSSYNGSSPFLSPQFFSIIPFIESGFGSYFVKGGMYRVSESLERLCREFNIKLNYRSELINVNSKGNSISGIIIKNDAKTEEIRDFDFLVSNFTNNKNLSGTEYFLNDDWSNSVFMMLLGMDRKYEELSAENILFSDDNEKEFIDVFEKKIPANDMTIQIFISKKINQADAPEGFENWTVTVNVPNLKNNFIWTDINKKKYREMILDRINSFIFLFDDNIRNHIRFCKILTPHDIESEYNSEFGSIYGLSSNSLYTLMKRPKNKSRKFNNLFFAGGNTNPGGGIPMSFLSGKIVSNLIQKENSR